MKKILTLLFTSVLLLSELIYAQTITENSPITKEKKAIYFESGINASLPVHIEMYRSHRLAIGVNARVGKIISPKLELGVRFDYDYRFIKEHSRSLTPESTMLERAEHNNFSLFVLKPNIQFNMKRHWFIGAEAGIGYAISDEGHHIGLGFVEEYHARQRFGACSGLYLGKYFIVNPHDNKLGVSLNLTQFLAHGHAENSLGLKINYRFIN